MPTKVWICYRSLKNGTPHIISAHATEESAEVAKKHYQTLEPFTTEHWDGVVYICSREVSA